jgi:hypothetical protein
LPSSFIISNQSDVIIRKKKKERLYSRRVCRFSLKNGQVQPYLIFNSVEPEEESVAGVVCTMNQKERGRGTSTSISLFRSERRPRIFLVGLIMDAFRELATPLAH